MLSTCAYFLVKLGQPRLRFIGRRSAQKRCNTVNDSENVWLQIGRNFGQIIYAHFWDYYYYYFFLYKVINSSHSVEGNQIPIPSIQWELSKVNYCGSYHLVTYFVSDRSVYRCRCRCRKLLAPKCVWYRNRLNIVIIAVKGVPNLTIQKRSVLLEIVYLPIKDTDTSTFGQFTNSVK